MPTSSERNYVGDMPKVAPEWLRAWAEARTWPVNSLQFRCDYLTDPMTGLKSKAASCRCTACGETFWVDWIPGGSCRYASSGGIRFYEDGKMKEVADYQSCRCPECGAEVTARHLRTGGEYAGEHAYPLTLHKIPEKGKKDRLALVCWDVYKRFDHMGRRQFTFHPHEAVVAEEMKLKRITFHGGSFGGSYFLTQAHQCRSVSDEMRDISEIVCLEGIEKATEGSVCENAKLELYLAGGGICFPAAWVRLWQKRGGKAESLLTCGAGGIIRNLMGQAKLQERTSYYAPYRKYNSSFPPLKELNWKARRPWEILRMHGKDELRDAVDLQREKNLGGKTWKMWLEGRAEGKPWTLEDAEALEQMETPERITATEIRPAKALRYLSAQRRRWPEDGADEILLTDYWNMAIEGYDLMRDPERMWPDRLKREHDRLAARRKKKANAAQDAKIEAWAEKLDRFAVTLDGITIRPARSTGELEAEGECLRHCVGSYAERVAAGATFIFFIRREEEPDMSWYTLNLDKAMQKVIQNRGMRNCDQTPEVQAFEDAWIAWVQAGAQRDKDGNPAWPGETRVRIATAAEPPRNDKKGGAA